MCPHGGLSLGTVVLHIYLNTINVVALKDDSYVSSHACNEIAHVHVCTL